MSNLGLLIALVIIVPVVIVVIFLVIYFVYLKTRRQPEQTLTRSMALVQDAMIEERERSASLAAEQIEEMVKKELDQHPDLADVKLDFGSVPDGTIDIWVDGEQYDNPEDIPDERIRDAIKKAVDTFNA
nr:hypothetical protein [Anaerolineae bacterium]